MAIIAASQLYTQPEVLAQFAVPANAAGKKYQVQLDLDPADRVDPAKYVELRLEQRATAGDPWQYCCGCVYKGGVYFEKDGITPQGPPGFRIDADEVIGKQVRLGISPGHGLLGSGVLYAAGDTITTGVTALVL